MSNMSYCRMENTNRDLQECINAAENEPLRELADSELEALMDMIDNAKLYLVPLAEDVELEIAKRMDVIDDTPDVEPVFLMESNGYG